VKAIEGYLIGNLLNRKKLKPGKLNDLNFISFRIMCIMFEIIPSYPICIAIRMK